MTENFLETLQSYILTNAIDVIISIVIFLVGIWLSKKLTRAVVKVLEFRKLDVTIINFTRSLVRVVAIFLFAIIALNTAGVKTASLIAVLGAAGLAIALAFKDTLSNLTSGVLILFYKPCKVGDFIEMDGFLGSVENINIFNTALDTLDNKRVYIPNTDMITKPLVNYSANDRRQLDLIVGVSYDSDYKKAKEIIAQVIKKEGKIIDDTETRIGIKEFGDNSVNILVRAWVEKENYLSALMNFNEAIKDEFDKNGISIPYPQRDLHIKELPKEFAAKNSIKASAKK